MIEVGAELDASADGSIFERLCFGRSLRLGFLFFIVMVSIEVEGREEGSDSNEI